MMVTYEQFKEAADKLSSEDWKRIIEETKCCNDLTLDETIEYLDKRINHENNQSKL